MTEAPVILLLAFIMPGQQPDVTYRLDYPSLEECAADEVDFLKHGSPRAPKGAIAMLAGCRVKLPSGEDG